MKKDKFLKIRISADDYELAKQLAADNQMTLSKYVRESMFHSVKVPVKGIIKDGKVIMEEK